MSESLEVLRGTWQGLPEPTKQAITTAINRDHQSLFEDWIHDIKHGFLPSFFLRRATALARNRLDAELFRKGEGGFAKGMLTKYFTTTKQEINRSWLESFSAAARSEPKKSSRELAESSLGALRDQGVDQELLNLYAATLRYACPHWFVDEPPDIIAIDECLRSSAPPDALEVVTGQETPHPPDERRGEQRGGLSPTGDNQSQCEQTRIGAPPEEEQPTVAEKAVPVEPPRSPDDQDQRRSGVQQVSPKTVHREDVLQLDQVLAVSCSIAERISSLHVAAAQETLGKVRAAFAQLEDDIREVEELVRRISKGMSELKACRLLPSSVAASVDVNTALLQTPSAAKVLLQKVDALVARVGQAFSRWNALIKHAPTKIAVPSLDRCSDLVSLAETLEAASAQMETIIREYADRLRSFSEFVAHITACEYGAAKRVLLDVDPRTYTDALWLVLHHVTPNGRPNDAEADWDATTMLEAMKSDTELRSLLIALAWDADPSTTMSLLKEAGPSVLGVEKAADATLQFLSVADLLRLCQEVPELTPSALSQTVTGCLYSAQQDRMHWPQRISQLPGVDPVCREFCMQLSAHIAAQGVAKTVSAMRQALFTGSSTRETIDAARSRVVGAITAPTGQHHTYHRLREIAREVYLLPLLSVVQRGSTAEALARWQADGDCAAKAQRCASRLSGPRKIDNQHILNTKRYLEDFEETLLGWSRAVSIPGADPLTLSFQGKAVALAQQSRRNSVCAQRLVEALQTHCVEGTDDAESKPGISVRTDAGGAVGACLTPWRLESWIESSNNADGGAGLQALLFDLVNEKADSRLDQSEAALVQTLFDREEIRAAARLADRNAEAKAAFDHLSSERYRRTVSEYESVMADAREIQYRDENVRLWLEEVDKLLAIYSYTQAADALKELAAAVKEFHEKTEGKYGALLVWLREAGEAVGKHATIQELETKAAALRAQAAPRRRHLEALTAAGERGQLPESLRGLCAALGQTLDTPARWPTPQQSQDLAQALGVILGYVERRWTSPAKTYALTASLCSGLHEWLNHRLQMLSNGDATAAQDALSQITDLALGISVEEWETTQILDHIGTTVAFTPQSPAPERVLTMEPLASIQEPVTIVDEIPSVTTPQPAVTGLTMARVVAECRRRTASLTEAIMRSPIADDKLRAKCREKDWDAVLSASLAITDTEEKREHAFSSYEVAAAVALFQRSREANTRATEHDVCAVAVMAISYALLLNDRSESYYFLSKEDLEQALLHALGRAVLNREEQTDDSKALRTNLATRLAEIWEGKATEPDYLWLQQILSSARLISVPNRSRTCAGVVTDVLWDAFTGLDVDVAQPRARLLLLAYRMRLVDEVIGHLAREHAKPLDHHIVQFLRAVQVAEANPTAWDEARRLAQSFVEQVPPRAMKPWRLFIDTLNRAVKRDATEQACSASLENYVFEPSGRLMLELRLSPSAYNFPANLTLEMQCAAGAAKADAVHCDVTDGDVLGCERVIRVGLPVDKDACDEVILLGYRLTGTTTQNDPIDVRGEWRVERASGRHQPLPAALVARAWKGRDGKPVDRSMNVFHGREKEQGDIDKVLRGEGGVQGSAMIIGQRRIGKTSLLMEAQAQYPAQDGHVCGVFVDFSGISKKAPDEPLSRTFFRALTTLEDAGGRNRVFNANFKAKLGNEWNDKLRHGLDPVTSLSSALTRFVDRMGEYTNGKVSRVAFFVDEFQSVFKFDRKEVDEVMWALRPVVQMSPSISLILAGSGLTRELVRGYDQAFFGSITTISLRPFVLPADFDAVRDTLLPDEVRQHLCPPGRDLGRLVQCAFDLCRGHPWFLSMLGYSAAQVLEGRPLSPALLNHVAREMIHGHVDFQDQETGAARFYGHIFDTLDSIGRRGDVAKLVLDNVARQVTLDWPWLTAEQAIHGPTLQEVKVSEREALDALRLLRDEDALDSRKGPQNCPQYRIRVPLIAEALKLDTADIAFEAVQDLKQFARSA